MATDGQAVNITISLLTEMEILEEFGKIAAKIALQNFKWQFMTMVYFNSSLCVGADIFLNSYRKAVVIGHGTFYPKFVEKTRQYILFGSDLTNIIHALKWMKDHEFDNTGKFIIICQDTDTCNHRLAFKAFWDYKITNVIFLQNINEKVNGFTYFPLKNATCVYDEPEGIPNLASCLELNQSCDLFPRKLRNLNGCPLFVSTIEHKPFMTIKNGKPTGTDGDLLCLLVEKLNGNLSLMKPRIGVGWGMMEPNGSWSGSLGDVYYEYANFSITSPALTSTRFSNFQMSAGYYIGTVVWYSPTAKIIPSFLKLSYPFQANARIALVTSFFVVVLSSMIIRSRFYLKLTRKSKLKAPRTSIVFYSWMICMGFGVPTARLPQKTGLLYIVLLWIWYCLLVRTLYQVSLISAMKSNYYYKDLSSIEEVITQGYPFGGAASFKDYYSDYPLVYNNWRVIEVSKLIPTLREISQGLDFVLAMGMISAKAVIWEEKLQVNMLSQKIVSGPAVVYFKKYSPLAEAVNNILKRLYESGFTGKFFRDYAPTVIQKSEDSIESIKIQHYAGCYAVLIMGWITSILFFFLEIIVHKFFKRSRTNRV